MIIKFNHKSIYINYLYYMHLIEKHGVHVIEVEETIEVQCVTVTVLVPKEIYHLQLRE